MHWLWLVPSLVCFYYVIKLQLRWQVLLATNPIQAFQDGLALLIPALTIFGGMFFIAALNF